MPETTENSRASWVLLLWFIQFMEEESRLWQNNVTGSHLAVYQSNTLRVALQRRIMSWDAMPAGFKKPYANTRMVYLVELLAMLGVYWLEFDWPNDRCLARGIGFLVKGQSIPNLGIAFDFKNIGQCNFTENRIIPVDQVKELCFGYVPTLYRNSNELRVSRRPQLSQDRTLDTLRLSSRKEIANTLAKIGCNAVTTSYILQGNQKDYHLFPITFEIIGMSAIWDNIIPKQPESLVFRRINRHIDKMRAKMDNLPPIANSEVEYPLLILLHEALEDLDEILTAKATCTQARDVLCIHLQEVLRCMNESSSNDLDPIRSIDEPRFEDIYTASAEDKYATFMSVYFKVVRRKVVAEAAARSQSLTYEEIWCTLVFRMTCWLRLHDFDRHDIQICKSELMGRRLPVYIM
ncbi:modin [Hirsutella rhossiliensis]|uniref:Modin n=1 Tax=Hirsutella rhossiliensis TaxID=111463 RepID=A0A9P8N859_9HYPO|nr:modin [Hirsutella rhossiliensis]KAH0968605.1 modin [Hirsutella rhossiliensis]